MRNIVKEHISFRRQLFTLIKLDLSKAYKGSALGWLWAFVQPLLLLFVYWFVLHFGLRAQVTFDRISSLSWLMVGIIPWLFMSDILNKGTSSMRTYKYLVTKMKFPVSVIPTFVGLARFIVHLFLLALTLAYIGFYGEGFQLTWLQLPLYMIAILVFFNAWSLFAAPLAVISKDFENTVKAATRILFWVSAILWNVHFMHIKWIKDALMFNPISFFVEGYRNSILYGKWFYEDPKQLIIFGGIFILVIILAIVTYRRSRKELADLL
jgi:teichoic acid transport system permease protein